VEGAVTAEELHATVCGERGWGCVGVCGGGGGLASSTKRTKPRVSAAAGLGRSQGRLVHRRMPKG
jgi:hypothetical protein